MTKSHHPHHKTLLVGGISTHMYGLENVIHSSTTNSSSNVAAVDVVFLLHGRTRSWTDTAPWAQRIVQLHDQAASATATGSPRRPLLAVTFDARNHGARTVDESRNLGWAEGNELHGLDMYSVVVGTARDVGFLIDFLPGYLGFDVEKEKKVDVRFENVLCAGVSLGGHETYVVLSDDHRVKAGVAVIGCPTFPVLMIPRATEEKKDERLPASFMDLVARLDPKLDVVGKKDLLVLKGDDDQLVPWKASEEFVGKLPKDKVEVVGYPCGHAFPKEMLEKSASWIVDWCGRH